MRTFNLLVALLAIVQALRYGRGALLFLAPRVRVSGEDGATPRSAGRLRVGAQLQELGFAPLGITHERAALGALERESDSYGDASRGTYADVSQRRPGADLEVTFFSPFEDGAAVLTANFPRRAVATRAVQVGGMPGASVEAQLAAHEVAVERFAAAHGTPAVSLRLDGRLAAANAWYRGFGRRELQRQHALAFAMLAFCALLLASAVNILLRGPR